MTMVLEKLHSPNSHLPKRFNGPMARFCWAVLPWPTQQIKTCQRPNQPRRNPIPNPVPWQPKNQPSRMAISSAQAARIPCCIGNFPKATPRRMVLHQAAVTATPTIASTTKCLTKRSRSQNRWTEATRNFGHLSVPSHTFPSDAIIATMVTSTFCHEEFNHAPFVYFRP